MPNGSNNLTSTFIDGANSGAGTGLNKLLKVKGAIYECNGSAVWQWYTTASTASSRLVGMASNSSAFLAATSAPGTTATFNATPPAPISALIDTNHDIWSYGDSTTGGRHTVTKNGVTISSTDASSLYFDGSVIYYKDGTPAWHSWNGSAFVSSSDPTSGAPGSPINLTSPAQTGTSVTLSFAAPLPSGGALDHGAYQVQYKAHSSGTWLNGPTINYCTTNSGTFTDTHSNTWTINSSNHPVINGTVTDTVSSCTMLLLVAGTVWQIDVTGAYYSTTPTGTISTAPSWAGPITSAPLANVVVGSLTTGTSYDFQVDVSNSHGTSSYTSTYTVSTSSTGPGPTASSAFLTTDFSVPVNYANPGTGQCVVSPRLWGVSDGAAGDDGSFGARGNNTNNNAFCAFTATTFQTPIATINPGLWVFIGNLPFNQTTPWFTGTSVNTAAFTNLINNFHAADPLGVSGIILGMDFTFGNATDYGTAMGNLASYFYNSGTGRLMSNGQPLPVIGFTGHNEPSPGTYNAATLASYYNSMKTAVKAVNPNYLVVGPQPDWWNNVDGGMSTFMSNVSGMDGISWDAFPQGSNMAQGSGLWTNPDYRDAFGGAVTDIVGQLQYLPKFLLQNGSVDSSCNDPDMADYHGAIWLAYQAIAQLNNAPVPMYMGYWDSFLQGTSGLIDENMNITPKGYLMAQGVRNVVGQRWAVTTNSAGLLVCTTTPSAGHMTMMVVNAGQGTQNSKTVAFSHWPINSTGNGTANTWQMTSSSTGDGTTGTVAVTSGVTAAMNFPDPSITIITL